MGLYSDLMGPKSIYSSNDEEKLDAGATADPFAII
jgi:hypothetical protein